MEDFSDLIEAAPPSQTPASENFSDLVAPTEQPTFEDDNFNPENLAEKAIAASFPTGPVSQGVNAGWIGLKGLVADAIPAMFDKAVGDKEGQQKQLQEYAQKQQEIQSAYPAPFKSLPTAYGMGKDTMDKISNVWNQAKYDIASGLAGNVPSIAAIVATGGILGPEVIGAEAALGDATDALLTTYAQRYASKAAITTAAGVAASEPQMVASSYIDRLQETGVDSPSTALVAGTLANGLTALPYMQIAKNLIPKPLQQEVTNEVSKIVLQRLTLSELPKGILGSGAVGGISTAAGTLVNQVANKIVTDAPYDVFSKDNVDHLIDSALSGGLTMGAIHGLTALPGAFKGSMNKYSPETDYTNTDVEKNSIPVASEPSQSLPSPEGSPEQPLPVRPSRKGLLDPKTGLPDEDAYSTARTNYENYFQDRFGKSPEQYYKERKAAQPEEAPETVKRETPEESAEAIKDIVPEAVPVVKAEPVAPLWKLTPDKLEEIHTELKLDDKAQLIKALGEEGAKEWTKLERKANSTIDLTGADRASDRMDEISRNFTKEQERLVYGIGQVGHSIDDVSTILEAHRDSSFSKDDPLEHVLGQLNKVDDVREAAEVPVKGGTPRAQADFIRIQNVLKSLKERGIPSDQIPELIYQNYKRRGLEDNDAEFMADEFVKAVQEAHKPVEPVEAPRLEGPTPEPTKTPFDPQAPKVAFDPDAVTRNIANAEPHDNLKANNFAIPKALDRITQEATGNEDYQYFQSLAEDPSQVSPEAKANILNMMRTGLDLVRGQAKRIFATDPTALTEFFHHSINENSPYLKPSDRVLLKNSMAAIRKKVAEKSGIDIRDIITNYPDDAIAAQAFVEFMKSRYEGKNPEAYGSATPVFNKLGNMLYRQGQVLNANKLNGIESMTNKLNQNQLNDALYGMAQKRNEAWLGRRMGETIDSGKDIIGTDPDFTDLANIKDPNDIKHITRADNYLGTAMLMATKYPWMSNVIQHFNNKIDRVAQISKQIGTVPRTILSKNKNNFSMIHDILDSGRMANTSAKIEGTEGQRVLRFKWGNGERIIQDQHFIDQFEQIRNNYKASLSEDEGDFRRYLNKQYGLPEGSSPKDIQEHANRLQKFVDDSGKDDPTANTVLPQIKELKEISDALTNMRKMQNVDYVPHLRFGKLAVMAFKKGEESSSDELVFMDGLEEGHKGKVNPVQEQELNKKLQKYRNNPDYYVLGDQPNNRMRLTQNEVLKKIPPQHVSMELIYSMFGDQSKESAQAMQDMIQGKINKSKLAFYLKPSSNIDGYSKDWPRALETWVHARSLNQSNKESDAELGKVLDYVQNLEKNGAYYKPEDPNAINPGDIKWVKDYIDYNRDRSSDLMLLRNLNFLQAMGGRFKTAVMQTLNGPQMMVPMLTMGGGNYLRLQASWVNNLRKSAQILAKSWGHSGEALHSDAGLAAIDKQSNLTPAQRDIVKTLVKSHYIDQTILDDNAGTSYESRDTSGQFRKQRELTSQLLGSHIGEAEKMSRLASIITTAKELADPETYRRLSDAYATDLGFIAFRDSVTGRQKGAYTEKEALAMYMMEQAHGRYGKSGRGNVQRGLSAAVFFPFSTQMLIQWELMKNLASTKGTAGKIAGMYMLGSFMALGGLGAMPGYATLKAGYNLYDTISNSIKDVPTPAKDFDIDLRRWLSNALGPDWANTIQRGPARNALGVDVSNTTTLPMSFETIGSKPLDVINGIMSGKAPDLTQMVGPALSPINTVAAAIKSRSIIPALPPVGRDLAEAMKGMEPNNPQGGIKTMNGTVIQPSKDNNTGEAAYTTPQRLARGLGFIPTRESQEKDAYHEEKFVDEANKSRASDIVQKATESQVNMMAALKMDNEKLADAYRNQVNDLRKAWINFQKAAGTPNINVDNFNNAIVKGAIQFQQGWKPKTVKGRMQQDEIKDRSIYGYQSESEKENSSPKEEDFSDLVQ